MLIESVDNATVAWDRALCANLDLSGSLFILQSGLVATVKRLSVCDDSTRLH